MSFLSVGRHKMMVVRRLGAAAAALALVAGATVVIAPDVIAKPEQVGLTSWLPLFQGRPDADHDGLYDDDETDVYGTNPHNPDTDGDGSDDGQEVYDGTDPLTPDQGTTACPDGNTVPQGQFCPTPTPTKCPDGTVVPQGQFCPTPTPMKCPDGTVVPQGQFCPTPVPCPPNQNRVEGACRSAISSGPIRLPSSTLERGNQATDQSAGASL